MSPLVLYFLLIFGITPESSTVPFSNSCKVGKDTLTQRSIYTSADTGPECEGGPSALTRAIIKKVKFPGKSFDQEYDSQYLVAFIVNTDGSISGQRIIKGWSREVGWQLLNAVKTVKWKPALCQGKKVPMLYKLPLIIDISTE